MSAKNVFRKVMTRAFRTAPTKPIRKPVNPLGQRIEGLEDRTTPTVLAYGLYDTAVNNAGTALAPGSIDPHYTVPTFPAGTFNAPSVLAYSVGYPNIGVDPFNGAEPVGNYTYQTTFNLQGVDPTTTTLTLSGNYAGDDSGQVFLNNTAVSGVVPYLTTGILSATGPFVAGTNTLQVRVNNFGGATNGALYNLNLAASGNVTYNGTAGSDLFVVTATGANSGTIQDLTRNVTIPFSGATNLTINGLGAGDALFFDYNGQTFTTPITYNGGGQADVLIIGGGTVNTVTHNFTNATDGTINLTGLGTVTYTGLAPIFDNMNAVNRVFNFNGGAETASLGDNGTGGDNISRVTSTLAESVDFVNPTGSLTMNFPGAGPDTINLNQPDSAIGAIPIDVNTSAGATVNVTGTRVGTTTTVFGTAGVETVNVSSNAPTNTGDLNSIDGPVEVSGGGGADVLNISESGIAVADTVTINGGPISGTAGGGWSVNSIGVPLAGGINVSLGSAGDTVNVFGTFIGEPVTVNANGGADTINVGSTGNTISPILSTLAVNAGGQAGDTLNINDQGNGAGTTYGVSATQVTRSASQPITYSGLGTSGILNVNGGTAANTYNVTGTSATTNTITAQGGVDAVNITNTAAWTTTNVNAGGGLDNVNVGNTGVVGSPGALTPVAGAVVVDGQANGANLVVDGSGAGVAANYAITSTTVTRSLPNPPLFGGVTYSNLAGGSLLLTVGSGNNIVDVSSTAFNVPTTVNTNAGVDTINVASPGNNLMSLSGALTVNAGGQTGDAINFNDQGFVGNAAYTVTTTTVNTVIASGPITYSGLALGSLNLNGAAGASIYTINGTAAATTTVTAQGVFDQFTINGPGLQAASTNNFIGGNEAGSTGDTFNLTPTNTAGTVINIDGQNPPAGSTPGDTLNINAMGQGVTITTTGLMIGGNPVILNGAIVNIETFNITNAGPVTVLGGAGNDTLLMTGINQNSAVFQFNSGQVYNISGVTSVNYQAGGGDDLMRVTQPSVANFFAPVNGIAYDGGSNAAAGDTLQLNGNLGFLSTGSYTAILPSGVQTQGVLTQTVGALTDTISFTNLSPIEDLTTMGTYTINGPAVGGTTNIVQNGLSIQNDPVTGVPATTYEVNFVPTAGAAELYRFRNKANVTYNVNSGVASTVNVTLPAVIDAGSPTPLTTLTINGGGGADVINVQAIPVPTTVNGGNGGDTINVGNAGLTQGILAPLTVNGQGGAGDTDTINVDDSADPNARVLHLTSTQLGGGGFGLAVTPGGAGFGPNGILTYGTTEVMNILGGFGTNLYNIDSTGATASTTVTQGNASGTFFIAGDGLAAGSTNTFNGGGAPDVLHVFADTPFNVPVGVTGTALNVNGRGPITPVNPAAIVPPVSGNGDILTIAGTPNLDNITEFLDTATGDGRVTGLGTTIGLTGMEQVVVDDQTGAPASPNDNFTLVDNTGLSLTAANPLAGGGLGVVFAPTGPNTGRVVVNNGPSAFAPVIYVQNIATNGFTYQGYTGGPNADLLTVLAPSDQALGSSGAPFNEATAPNAADLITVSETGVQIVAGGATGGGTPWLGVTIASVFGTPTVSSLVVRGGNEVGPQGDLFDVTPSSKVAIYLDGMNPPAGSNPGDIVSFRAAGVARVYTDPAFGPPALVFEDFTTNFGVGAAAKATFVNMETVNVSSSIGRLDILGDRGQTSGPNSNAAGTDEADTVTIVGVPDTFPLFPTAANGTVDLNGGKFNFFDISDLRVNTFELNDTVNITPYATSARPWDTAVTVDMGGDTGAADADKLSYTNVAGLIENTRIVIGSTGNGEIAATGVGSLTVDTVVRFLGVEQVTANANAGDNDRLTVQLPDGNVTANLLFDPAAGANDINIVPTAGGPTILDVVLGPTAPADVTVNGGVGNTLFNLAMVGTTLPAPVVVNGGVGTNTLRLTGTAGADTFGNTPGASSSTGIATLGGTNTASLGYSNIQNLDYRGAGGGDTVNLMGSAGPDTITVTETNGAAAATVTATGQPAISFSGLGGGATLNVMTDGGDDMIIFNQAVNWGITTVNIDGGPPTASDTLQILGTGVADLFVFDPMTRTTTVTPAGGTAVTYTGTNIEIFQLDGAAPAVAPGDKLVVTSALNGQATLPSGVLTASGLTLAYQNFEQILVGTAPTAINDAATTSEDTATVIDVLGNDVIPNGGSAGATITLVTLPTNGTAVVLAASDPTNPYGAFGALNGGNPRPAIRYTPNANFPMGVASATDMFNYRVTDQNGQSAVGTVTVTVNAVNDAPTVAVPGPQTAAEDTALAIAGITVSDAADGNVGTGTVTVSVLRGTLTVGNTAGLTAIGANPGASVTFTGPWAALNTALASLSYQGNPNYNGPDTLTVSVNDNGNIGTGGALTASATVAITVTAVNDAPTITAPAAVTTNEDTTFIFPGTISVSDAADGNVGLGTVTLSVANGTLTLGSVTGLSNFTGNGTATVTLTGPWGALNNALNALSYRPNANFNGADTLTINVNDNGNTGAGGAMSATATVTINVTAVNDPPVIVAPPTASVNEDGSLVFPGTVSVNDAADGNVGNGSVTVSVLNGTLTLGSLAGLVNVTGNGTNTVNFTGPWANLANALNGLLYQPTANYNGPDTLTISANDNGNTGSGGAMASTAAVAITVNPVNDAPVVTVPGPQTTGEDMPLALGGIQVNDTTDMNMGQGTVTLTVLRGTLTLGNVAGLTSLTGNGTATVNFTAPWAILNTALATLTYTPATNSNGPDTLTVSVNDNGNTGSGGPLAASGTVAITVTAMNDAPTITPPAPPPSVLEGATLSITGLSVSDAADGNVGQGTLTLTVTNGNLTLPLAGLTIDNGTPVFNGNGTATFAGTVTVTGTWANLNAALAGLRYASTGSFNGTETLTVTINDNGNVGTGGPLSTTTTVAITVLPVNNAPVVVVPAGPLTVLENNPLAPAGTTQLVFPGTITVNDTADGNVGTGTVTVTALRGTLTLGSLANVILFTGNGTNTVTFSAPWAALNTALNGLTYQGNPGYNGPDTITVSVNDNGNVGAGGALSGTGSVAVTVNPVNSAPTVVVPGPQTVLAGGSITFTAGLNSAITVADAADGNVGQGTVTLSVQRGTLTLGSLAGLTGVFGNGTNTVTFTGAWADLNNALAGLRYTADASYAGLDALTVSVNDNGNVGFGGALTTTATVVITASPVNRPPTVSVPGPQTVQENSPLAVTPNLTFFPSITVSDAADGNVGTGTVTVSAPRGTFTLASLAGLSNVTGYGTGVLNFSGTWATLNAALAGLTYRGVPGFNGLDAVTVTVNDNGNVGVGGALSATGTIQVNVTAVNDAPALTVPGPQTVTEDTGLTFNGTITVNDNVDGNVGTGTVSVTVGRGTLSLGSLAGLALFTGNGTSTVTFTGTWANLNNALNGLVYSPAANYNGPDTLTVSINDNGNVGSGGALTATGAVALTVTAANDAPTVAVPGAQTVFENSPLSPAPQLLFPGNITVADALDGNVGSGTVTLTVGRGTLTLGTIAGLTSVTGNGTSTVSFTAPWATLNAALTGLSYQGNPNYNGPDVLTVSVSDNGNVGGGALSGSATVAITVLAVNNAPTVTAPGAATTSEDTALTFTGITVSDALDGNVGSGTVTVAAARGTLTLGSQFGLVSVTGNGTGTVTFTGPWANLNAALAGLTYTPTANSTGPDTLTVGVNDNGNTGLGGSQSAGTTVAITVTPVNDAPAVVAPGPQTVFENSPQAVVSTLSFPGLSVNDTLDGNAGSGSVTVSVLNGRVTLASLAGLTAVSGNGTGLLQFTAPWATLNTVLAGMTYQGNPGYNGPDTLLVSVNDNGNTGTGGALAASATVDITVLPVNDVPTITAPATGTVAEDTALAFNGNITVNDTIDGNVGSATVTLTVTRGTLTLGSIAGLVNLSGNGTSQVQFTAPWATANAALNGLTYQGTANSTGPDTLTISVNDNGNFGLGGQLAATATVALTVTAVNDAPTVTVPGAQTVAENSSAAPTSLTFLGTISVADAADGNLGIQTVSLSVSRGTLTLGSVAGLTLVNGNASSVVTISGTVANLNAALNGLKYTPTALYNGPDLLTVNVNDNGNTGTGGPLTATGTVAIAVLPVNQVPVGSPDSATTAEDTAVTFDVRVNDTDVETASGQLVVSQINGTTVVTGTPIAVTGGTVTRQVNGTLTFTPASNANGTFTFTYQVTDSGDPAGNASNVQTSAPITVTVTVTPVNDAPVAASPATATTAEDSALTFNGNVTVNDALDSNTGNGTVTVTVQRGTLTLATQNALVTVTGNGTNSVFLTGPWAALNAALNGLSYLPTANFNGSDVMTVSVNDNGNVGSGGALSSSSTTAITVTPVNDAPTVTVPGGQTATEDVSLPIAGISVADTADGNPPNETVTVSVLNGTVTIGTTAGLAAIGGNGTGTVSFTGSFATLNAALASLSYKGNPNFNGSDTMTVTINDNGNVGAGSPLSASAQIPITVTAVADNPNVGFGSSGNSATGTENVPIPLNINVTPTGGMSEVTSIRIAGVPDNATFNQGTNLGGGVWQFTPAQLNGLTIRVTDNTVVQLQLFLTATSTEPSNGSTATTSSTFIVNVLNTPPTASLTGGRTVSEGTTATTVTVTGQSDPSPEDTTAGFRYAFDFNNDGTFDLGGNSYGSGVTTPTVTVPQQFLDDGPSTRTVRVRTFDKDGGSSDATTSFSVTNVAPTASLGASGRFLERMPVTVTFTNQADVSAADTAAGFTYSFDTNGDGVFDVVNSKSPSVTFTPPAEGNINVVGRITDKDGGFTDYVAGGQPLQIGNIDFFAVGAGTGGAPLLNLYAPTRALKTSFFAYPETFTGGVQVATADVTGDGLPDIITGAGPGGAPLVNVFDGSNGRLIYSFYAYEESFRGGVQVAGGDIDGDGRADIIAGAGNGGAPRVVVFSGATGAMTKSFMAYEDSFRGGVNVAAGDVLGTGRDQIIAGAGVGGSPRIVVIDPNSLGVVKSFFAFDSSFRGGVNVASGDFDGNGRDEILYGAGEGGGPAAGIIDGATGAVTKSFFAFDPEFRGGVRVGTANLDNNRTDDIVVGTGPGPVPGPNPDKQGSVVRTFNGSTLKEFDNFYPFDPNFQGGVYVG